jgi:hypothetical protein
LATVRRNGVVVGRLFVPAGLGIGEQEIKSHGRAMSSTLFYAATEYLDRGWSIIPVRGKTPAVQWRKFQTQLPTHRQLVNWFPDDTDHTGLAVVFGMVSGNLGQRDFDTRDAYRAWIGDHADLAATLPMAATSRGRHVYFRYDAGELADVRRRIGKIGNGAIKLDGGELRADVGCYSVLPPSLHPSGILYRWLKPPADVVPIVPLSVFYPAEIAGSIECYTCNEFDEFAVSGDVCEEGVSSDGVYDDENLDRLVQQAIDATMPSGYGQRNRQVFEFVRWLKAIPQLASDDVQLLKPLVRRWHAAALPLIRTKAIEVTWLDFAVAWERVKVPAGRAAIGAIYAQALAGEMPLIAHQYESPKLRKLVALCRQLQRRAGDRPFFLSCRTAGELLKVSAMTVSRWLKLLVLDKVLVQVAVGEIGSGKASEFRYVGGPTGVISTDEEYVEAKRAARPAGIRSVSSTKSEGTLRDCKNDEQYNP